MTRICGAEAGRQHDGANNCQFISSIVMIASLAIAAYGAVVLSRHNAYTYNQGVSMVAAGGVVAFAALLILATACRQTRTDHNHTYLGTPPSEGFHWVASSVYGRPRRGDQQTGSGGSTQAAAPVQHRAPPPSMPATPVQHPAPLTPMPTAPPHTDLPPPYSLQVPVGHQTAPLPQSSAPPGHWTALLPQQDDPPAR